MHLRTQIRNARAKDRAAHRVGDKEKLGVLRAGNSGILSEHSDEAAGGCLRLAHIRTLGIEVEIPKESVEIMWELGFAFEDQLVAQLEKTIDTEKQLILREEQIPIGWFTSNGTRVTGRPDIVVCDRSDWVLGAEDATLFEGSSDPQAPTVGSVIPGASATPRVVIECKTVHSLWTVRDILLSGGPKPKLKNLIQVAHYLWQIQQRNPEATGKLIYRSYSHLGQGMAGSKKKGSDNWIVNQLPAPGSPGSEYFEYTYYLLPPIEREGMRPQKCSEDEYWAAKPKLRTYSVKHVRPFELIFDIRIDSDGRVFFRLEPDAPPGGVESGVPPSSPPWTLSIVSVPHIQRFFEFASRISETGDLGPRPTDLTSVGKGTGWSDCTYCTLESVCNSQKEYKEWLRLVREHTATGSKEHTDI